MRTASYRRLRRKKDFSLVFSGGRRASDNLFRMIVCAGPSPEFPSRYGLSVGRRVGNSVKRNLVKRRLREILGKLPAKDGFDIVVHAFPAVADAGYFEMRESIAALAGKLKIMESGAPTRRDGGICAGNRV